MKRTSACQNRFNGNKTSEGAHAVKFLASVNYNRQHFGCKNETNSLGSIVKNVNFSSNE